MEKWLAYLQTNQRYASNTLSAYRRDLLLLLGFYPDIPSENLSNAQIRHAIARLHAQGYSPRSLARILSAWRGFYQWWIPQTTVKVNPALDVKTPKIARSLPKALSVEQTQALLDHPTVATGTEPADLRDQAMFEVLYSSGLRLAELVSLDIRYTRKDGYESVSWLNLDEGEVTVTGKGGKTRSVPLGRTAISALTQWLAVRHKLLPPASTTDDQSAVFLGTRGRRIAHRVVQLQLKKLSLRSGIPAQVHPHVLRHSFASHVLQSAQDLRAVQEMLGHANIATTQIYTRLDFQHLAQVYDKAHPRAKMDETDKEK
jgi:integrase/recombinase XerC